MTGRNVCAVCMDPSARTDAYFIGYDTTIVLCPRCAEELGLFDALADEGADRP